MTYEPLEGYLLLLQDLSQWTSTHEGMIISDLHEGLNTTNGCCWIIERGGESLIEKFNPFSPLNASVISM
jgi:hypothetical protein